MTTPDEPSTSLIAALSEAHIPAANHEFIRKFIARVDVDSYEPIDGDKPYVRVARRDGLPALHIYSGYTNGFTSEEEIVRVAGTGVERSASSRRGTWYVAHPVNQIRAGGERSRDIRREAGRCSCGMELSLTGECFSCS